MSTNMKPRDKCSVSTISSVSEGNVERPRVVKLVRNEDGYGFYLKKMRVRLVLHPCWSISKIECLVV